MVLGAKYNCVSEAGMDNYTLSTRDSASED